MTIQPTDIDMLRLERTSLLFYYNRHKKAFIKNAQHLIGCLKDEIEFMHVNNNMVSPNVPFSITPEQLVRILYNSLKHHKGCQDVVKGYRDIVTGPYELYAESLAKYIAWNAHDEIFRVGP